MLTVLLHLDDDPETLTRLRSKAAELPPGYTQSYFSMLMRALRDDVQRQGISPAGILASLDPAAAIAATALVANTTGVEANYSVQA